MSNAEIYISQYTKEIKKLEDGIAGETSDLIKIEQKIHELQKEETRINGKISQMRTTLADSHRKLEGYMNERDRENEKKKV